jgi:hypothetical protein
MTQRRVGFNPEFKTKVLKSIRTKTLGKLVLLYWHFLYDRNCEASRKILERERRRQPYLRFDKSNIVYELRPEDIIPVLHCSRRTAVDYIQALRWLCG